MGKLIKSQTQNIRTIDGNGLSVYIDGDTSVLMLKDIRGNIQPLSDYVTGGSGSQNFQQVTDNGKTTTNYIETGNITATDVIGDTAPFTGNYSPSSSPSDKLIKFVDINTGNVLNIKTIKPNDSARDVYIQGGSGILAYVSDLAGVMRISDYIGTTLTSSKAVVTDANSKLAPSATTANQIGYLSNLSSDAQTQIDAKQALATATTGAVISFATPQIYNSFSSPTASNITDSLGTAKIGIVQKIYSNKATEPTYPAGWVNLSGTYSNSVTNIIYCEWCEGSRVEYWIVEA